MPSKLGTGSCLMRYSFDLLGFTFDDVFLSVVDVISFL